MTDLTPAETPATPAVPAAAEPAAPVVVQTAPVRKSGALGGFALILGLLAFFGDVAVLVIGIVQVVSLFSNFDVSQLFTTTNLGALGAFLVIVGIVFWVGLVVAALAVLLGFIAAIKNRGRVAAIFGIIFGILVLITHLGIGFTVLSAGTGLSNLGN
ncbi:MAG: hypothetical protein JWP32_1499 [Schumannella sp.]|nr:hypothetical protein [Schumannella sp.]